MKCPKCQFENPEGMKFCGDCGTKLEMLCPHCNYPNPPQFKFCGECGQKLSLPSKPPPKELSFDEKLDKIQRYLPKGLTEKILSQRDKIEGERKQVTVMFCDMEGFTALSEQIGPEEAYTIMDQVYEILIHKVHDFEGTVNEMTGDGIVALFGAPIALEDAPQRAIRSALAIHREMVKFSEKVMERNQTPVIRMRIGIHTGPVVVGTVGNDLRVEFKAVGDTVNLASRIEKIAEPGTTYITEDTFKLTEGLFRFEGLGECEIKGKEDPVKVYRVLAPSTRRTRFDVSSESGLTPFVGRERELELLLDGFKRAKDERGQAFSIVAEAGLGKSRLLYEFRKSIANENVTFLEGKCLSYSRDVAYHPVIEILKTNFNVQDGDEESKINDKVKKGLRKLEVDESATLPYLLELLSVKDSGIYGITISPQAKRVRTLESLKKIVLKRSERRPIIMAVEDLHWIDRSSEESFKYLFEALPGARVLLIFTYRPEFIHTWGGRSYHSQLNLMRLSNRESLSMVAYLLDNQNIETNLEKLILNKTEGIPFFIEEFIRSLRDLKMIEKRDSTYHFKEGLKEMTIPSRIQDVIMARVDSLPEGVKQVLQVGSVIGREFNHKLLKELIEISEQDLLSYLSHLRNSELLYERGIYPQSIYIFKHALTQEAVFQSLLKSTRQKYHQVIAQVLEQNFPETADIQPETLGHHFTEAGLAEPAIPYWQKAGEIAVRRSAYSEAISHLSKGLELLKTLPETQCRIHQELNLQVIMGFPLGLIAGFASPELERIYSRALELCQKVGDNQKLFQVLQGLCLTYRSGAEYQTAYDLAERLLQLAKTQPMPEHLLVAHHQIGGTSFYLGEITKAHSHLEQAIALYEPHQYHTEIFPHFIYHAVSNLCFMAGALWLLGYPDRALKSSQDGLTLAHELSHSISITVALFWGTLIHSFLRNIYKTQKRAETCLELAAENRFPMQLGWGTIMRCWALGLQNKEDKVISQMYQAMDDLRSIGYKQLRPLFLGLLSEVCVKMGQTEKGMNVLEEAQVLINKTGERFWEAEIYRLKGELLLYQLTVNQSEVESCFNQALEIARHQHAKALELRAAMSLSRLWQSQGKKEEARNLLSEIYSWFTEGFDTSDLKDAKALMDELS